jgi:hypothetical protein
MQNDIEKLGGMIVQGEEDDRFWTLFNYVIEGRKKINELIDFTYERTRIRDQQMLDVQKEIRESMKKINKALGINQ